MINFLELAKLIARNIPSFSAVGESDLLKISLRSPRATSLLFIDGSTLFPDEFRKNSFLSVFLCTL